MIINDLDGYYIVFDTKNWNTELDTLLTNHTFSFCKVTKLFLTDNGKQRFYLTLQELILFSQQFVLSSQGSITTY